MDVSNLCRSCMKDLAAGENNINQNALQMFSFCTNIVLNAGDPLPQKFCSQCTTAIDSCYTFITIARDVDAKLREIVITHEDIKPEIADHSRYNLPDLDFETDSYNETLESCNDLALDTVEIETKPESEYNNVRKEQNEELDKNYQREVSLGQTNNEIESELSAAKIVDIETSKQTTKIEYNSEWQCPYCDRVFIKNKSLKQHIEKHLEQNKATHESADMSSFDTVFQCFICKLCSKSYVHKTIYDKHMLTFHSNEESKEPTNTTILCNICKKNFISITELVEHIMLAHVRHHCLYCSISFTTSQELRSHNKSEHNGLNTPDLKTDISPQTPPSRASSYTCNYCKKVFQCRKGLKCHLHVHDRPLKPHLCDVCGKSFTTSQELRRHNKSVHNRHNNADMKTDGSLQNTPSSYSCNHCKKTFQFRCELKSHLHVHDSTLKPLLCDICGMRFSFRRALLDHRRAHTGEKPFKCDQCKFSCATSGNLRRHCLRSHNTERNHECSQCGKAFFEVTSLKSHMKSHTGERPYKCPSCEKCYACSSKRKKHLIRYHGMDPTDVPRLNKDGGPAGPYTIDKAKTKTKTCTLTE